MRRNQEYKKRRELPLFIVPNEDDRTTMPVMNDTKEWIRNPWTQDVLVFIFH